MNCRLGKGEKQKQVQDLLSVNFPFSGVFTYWHNYFFLFLKTSFYYEADTISDSNRCSELNWIKNKNIKNKKFRCRVFNAELM